MPQRLVRITIRRAYTNHVTKEDYSSTTEKKPTQVLVFEGLACSRGKSVES